MAQFSNEFRNGLATAHQPRPWHCTIPAARYCPVHGDCTCRRQRGFNGADATCTLHGPTSTHPHGSALR